MINHINELAVDLQQLIKDGIWQENTVGWSDSKVFRIQGLANGSNGYLKIVEGSAKESLKRDVEILKWLEGKVPVPEVYYYDTYNGREFLLMSEVEGVDASQYDGNPEELVLLLADGLRWLHSVDISNCPFDQRLDIKLMRAKKNVEMGWVDESDFQPEYMGKSAGEIYNLLVEKRPEDEDLVFTHGDYCLPNVLIKDGQFSGFIDLGRAGVADRYQDLALLVRSIKYNLEEGCTEQLIEMMFERYGLREVDWGKVEYYIMLDEVI